MANVFEDVAEFHAKFLLVSDEPPVPKNYTSTEMLRFRTGFLIEESQEHNDAANAGDLVKAIDANLDAIYVAVGNLRMMGVGSILASRLWDIVHRANMAKVRAERAEDSARSTTFDVIKPPGWVAPDESLRRLLRRHGADV